MTLLRQSTRPLRPLRTGRKLQWLLPVRQQPLADPRRGMSTEAEAAPTTALDFKPKDDLATRFPVLNVQQIRVVPSTQSYYSKTPIFSDHIIALVNLVSRYGHLPTLPLRDQPRLRWEKVTDYRRDHGEQVKASLYAKAMLFSKRLYEIHPDVRPAEVDKAIMWFHKGKFSDTKSGTVLSLDDKGRALGVGKRKSSVARAWVVEGTGEVLINGKNLGEAFFKVHDRESAIWPLRVTERMDKYNVWAVVNGGGTTGQGEAMAMAIARGMVAHEPALKTALRKAGCITRDPRSVERKKAGNLKARKKTPWNAR